MTTYYIDPENGNDTTGDGSKSAPYKLAPSQAGAVVPNALGNTYLIKRGTIMSLPIDANYSGNATSESQRTVYGAYGVGQNPIIDVAGTAAYCLRVQNKDYVTFENFTLYNATNTCMQAINNVTRSCNYLRINNVISYNAGFDGVSLTQPTTVSGIAPSAAQGVVFTNCEGHNCGQHGVAITAYAQNAKLINCKASNNSLVSSGWGVYHGGHAVTFTGSSGWTIAGNIKSRTDIHTKPYSVISGNTEGGKYFLTENGGTPTTPATGEWGYSTGTLYINLGVVSGGYSVAVVYQPNINPLILNGVAWNHQYFDQVGIGLDRGVVGGTVQSCYAFNNLGSGIEINQASNTSVIGCVGKQNGQAVFISTTEGTTNVYHNTSDDLQYGIRVERLYTGDTVNIKNNYLLAPVDVYTTTISGTVTEVTNATSGEVTQYLQPVSGSSLISSGTFLGSFQDKNNTTYWVSPTIGAYEYIRSKLVRT